MATTSQPDLWDAGTRAKRNNPDTSHAAARHAEPVARDHWRKILAALALVDNMNYTEIAGTTGLEPVAVNRRLGELRVAGFVERLQIKRMTTAGRLAYCYRRIK